MTLIQLLSKHVSNILFNLLINEEANKMIKLFSKSSYAYIVFLF